MSLGQGKPPSAPLRGLLTGSEAPTEGARDDALPPSRRPARPNDEGERTADARERGVSAPNQSCNQSNYTGVCPTGRTTRDTPARYADTAGAPSDQPIMFGPSTRMESPPGNTPPNCGSRNFLGGPPCPATSPAPSRTLRADAPQRRGRLAAAPPGARRDTTPARPAGPEAPRLERREPARPGRH